MIEKKPQLQDGAQNFSARLSSTRQGARLARLLAGSWMRTRDLSAQLVESAEHLVAELAANAVLHGRVPHRNFLLALEEREQDGLLRIEVTDTRGDYVPMGPKCPGPYDESGRGLFLVEAIADRWGVTVGPVPRKTVWAELDLPEGELELPQGELDAPERELAPQGARSELRGEPDQPRVSPATSSSAAR